MRHTRTRAGATAQFQPTEMWQPTRFIAKADSGFDNEPRRSGFQQWLRKLTNRDSLAGRQVADEFKLAGLKRHMTGNLNLRFIDMSHRDVKIFLRVLSAADVVTIRAMRFEYFDLMCRQQGEAMAACRLREFDALLNG